MSEGKANGNGEQHVVAETVEDAQREIVDADAAFGGIVPEVLARATKLRWLQAPQIAPAVLVLIIRWFHLPGA